MSKKKDVVVKENTLPSTEVDGLGIGDDFGHEDLQRGYISIMQGLSEAVTQGEAQIGDIRTYPDNELVGSKDKGFEFMVAGTYNFWVEQDGPGVEGKFLSKYPGISENEHAWEEETPDGMVYRFFNRAYVLLRPEEIAVKAEIPYEYAMRSTTLKFAKKFNSLIKKLRDKGIASWDKVFVMKTTPMKGDKGTWWVPTFDVARDATEQEVEACKKAFLEFNSLKKSFMEAKEPETSSEPVQDTEY